jgi:hypothetical protein
MARLNQAAFGFLSAVRRQASEDDWRHSPLQGRTYTFLHSGETVRQGRIPCTPRPMKKIYPFLRVEFYYLHISARVTRLAGFSWKDL